MVTIIVKNADYSGDFVGYVPPVDGATLAAFVGDDDLALRNFGSGGDLTAPGAFPAGGELAGFREVNYLTSYFVAPGVFRPTGDATLMSVWSKGDAASGYVLPLSTEHNTTSGTTGRRGIAIGQYITGNTQLIQTDVAGGTNRSNAVAASAAAQCGIGTYQVIGGNFVQQMFNMTAGTASSVGTYSDAEGFYNAEEADKPFNIGRNPIATAGAGLIGFVAVWPFALTETQRGAMYTSVKKRFTSLGVTI